MAEEQARGTGVGGVFGGFDLCVRAEEGGLGLRLICVTCAEIVWQTDSVTGEHEYSLDVLLSTAAFHAVNEHFRGQVIRAL